MAAVKKLPDPPRHEQSKEEGSLFSDHQLWSYKYGSGQTSTSTTSRNRT